MSNTATPMGRGLAADVTRGGNITNSSGPAVAASSDVGQTTNESFNFQGTNNLSTGTGNAALDNKTGAGSPTLTGVNTYTGNTSISAGTLQLGNSTVVQNRTLAYNRGNLSFGTLSNATVGGLSGNRDVALGVGQNNQSTTYTGVVSGTGLVVKAGSGTLVLDETSTYTGGTTLNSGTVETSNNTSAVIQGNNFAGGPFANGTVVQGGSLTMVLPNGPSSNTSTMQTGSAFRAYGDLVKSAAVTGDFYNGTTALVGGQPVTSNAVSHLSADTNNLVLNGGTLSYSGATVVTTPTPALELGVNRAANVRRIAPAPVMAGVDEPIARPPSDVQFPPPVVTAENAFSTFSLNVSDVAYRLAQAALQNRRWPDPANVRTEEFLNAFQYHDPAPRPDEPCALNYELAQNPFEAGGDLLRVSLQTAAAGRDRATPLRLTILLDASGSMTRSDRVATLQAAIRALGAQLRAGDTVSLVTFARTAQARAIGVPAENFAEIARLADTLVPEGGTNMEEALQTAYQVARQTFQASAQNRVILLTDGAANLGQLDPKLLADVVEQNRRAGIALDAYGVGWDGYDDTVLEALTRKSDGRYGFLKGPEDVDAAFAQKLAGALAPAALDVKLQIEFNPQRVTAYRLMGYNNQRLTREQFRDNTVSAAELAATEQGTALYNLSLNPNGAGPIGVARVRFRDPVTNEVRELSWTLQYRGAPTPFDQAGPSMRLAATAAYFAEYLQRSPFAAEVTPRKLQETLAGVPEAFAPDPRPAGLADALAAAAALAGN